MNCTLWQEKLAAYVDGELAGQELNAMDEHLCLCSDCAAEAFRLLEIKRATRKAATRYTPPPELRHRIEKSLAPQRGPLAFLWSPVMAVAFVLVLSVATSAMLMIRHSAREHAAAEFVDLHVAAMASANPVDVVSTDRHTVKPWFQGKLPFTFNLPELEGSEYRLVGGKLVYYGHRPGAQLIFALRKHELSAFIVQDDGTMAADTNVSGRTENGFSVETWSAAGLHYVVVSDAGASDVHTLSDKLRSAQRP